MTKDVLLTFTPFSYGILTGGRSPCQVQPGVQLDQEKPGYVRQGLVCLPTHVCVPPACLVPLEAR